MKQVVVTGMGIVSPIGNNVAEVTGSLRAGRSGIAFCEEYAERGFRSHVHGVPKIDMNGLIDRKLRRFMGDGAAYNYISMSEAIADSGLKEADVSSERTGLVMGSGGPSTSALVGAADTARARKVGSSSGDSDARSRPPTPPPMPPASMRHRLFLLDLAPVIMSSCER